MRVLNTLIGFSAGVVMTGLPLIQILAEIAFPGVPSRTIALILRPGFHWRGRDAGRPGSRQ